MLKIIERILTGISALLVALLVFGTDFVSQQWVSGLATVVTLFAGLLYQHNKKNKEESSEHPMPVERTPATQAYAQQTYAVANAVEAHGDPLGRWWRR